MHTLRLILLTATASAILTMPLAAADQPANPIDPSVSPPEATTNVVPSAQTDNAIAQLPKLAQDILARTHIPGLAISVVRDGKTVYAAGFGVRRVGTTDAVDADTVFQIASLSKPLAATVVAHQVGAGIVSWDTVLQRFLPWFALNDPWITTHVTIGDMFAHRSGLPDHAGDELEDLGYDRDQVLRRLRFAKLHSFRDEYAYTNFGLTAAAEAVAVASHSDWATLSQQVLYGPLGMTSTSSRYADFIGRSNRAAGHVLINGQYAAKYQRQPDAQSPAGGVSSSANDMARWMSLVLQGGMFDGKRIIAADALLPAITAQIVSSPSHVPAARAGFYGYGFNVGTLASGRVSLGHSGAFALGAATNFVMIPSLGVGIDVLSNAAPIGAVEALGMDFADLVQFGVVTRDWLAAYGALMQPMSAPTGSLVGKSAPAHPAPARQPDDYAGNYHNDYFGDLGVERRGGSLMLLLGPKRTPYKLSHWDGDVFTFEPIGENANAGSISKVTFAVKATGRADKVDVEFFDDSGWGAFVRRQ
ncbi:MAG TPA: serine hydrolase [Acetobacteraceae bacterium]|nr:serine hydrolase [Acetobacteraceae bacterium]